MPQPASPARFVRNGVMAWLDWYERMGVTDAVADPGANAAFFPDPVAEPPQAAVPAVLPRESDRIVHARAIAARCATLAELEKALAGFDGCPLRETATRLCFADGQPDAPLMLIGEAPGAEEDRLGRPFVGPSGQLLDKMLTAIGLDRSQVWITNILFWRPPGNRPPTTIEIATCQPFLERQIELLAPRLILFVGGIAARALLDVSEGVTKLRGRRYLYRPSNGGAPIPAHVTFHPAYLLRQPLHKRLVWRDLLNLRRALDEGLAGGPPM